LVKAQLIDNRLDFSITYSYGKLYGQEAFNKENYIFPSLYPNYKGITGYSLKGIFKARDIFSFGLDVKNLSTTNWISKDYDDFNDSKTKLISFSPLIRVHNKFHKSGLLNRFSVFIECGPSIGYAKLMLSRPIFHIQAIHGDVSSDPLTSGDLFLGINASTGITYRLNQDFSICLGYSQSYNRVSSGFYMDKIIHYSEIDVGVIMKFNKNKYYYY